MTGQLDETVYQGLNMTIGSAISGLEILVQEDNSNSLDVPDAYTWYVRFARGKNYSLLSLTHHVILRYA